VDFPELIVPDVREHLNWIPLSSALVFANSAGSPLAHSNFRRRVWLPALAATGLAGVHLHDLRHTGNQLMANAGANPKELMVRMGHDSERAALVYLHSTGARQRALADAVGEAAQVDSPGPSQARTPANLAREWHEAARLLGRANDQRPNRDSNPGPTA